MPRRRLGVLHRRHGELSSHDDTAISGAGDTAPRPEFPVNEFGETYGSELDAPTPDQAPDLISAYATNGDLGYVRKADLHPDFDAKLHPEAAMALNAQRKQSRFIPVYMSDGRTIVGRYEVLPSDVEAPAQVPSE